MNEKDYEAADRLESNLLKYGHSQDAAKILTYIAHANTHLDRIHTALWWIWTILLLILLTLAFPHLS